LYARRTPLLHKTNTIDSAVLHPSFSACIVAGDAATYAKENRKCRFAPNAIKRPGVVANGHVKIPGRENLKRLQPSLEHFGPEGNVSRRVRVFQPKLLPVIMTEPGSVYVLLSVLVG
jgi:hypothetical protein